MSLEDKAERIGIWWEGHSEGARKQLAKYIVRALREAADDARQEEREACITAIREHADSLLDLALGFASDEPGNPRGYYQREAAGARGAIAAIQAAAEKEPRL